MQMSPEQLEFAISQYIDDVLPPLERAALERRLAEDANARETLEEYRRLQQLLRSPAPLPEVRWDRLAAHLSEVVARQPLPVRHYALRSRLVSGLAIAASLLLAVGITAIVFLTQDQPMLDPPSVAVVEVGQQQAPAGPVVQEVAIGPSQGVSEAYFHDQDGVLSRPSRVIIASAREAVPPMDNLPY
jgi:anti-sigma factor RsiW